MQNLEKYHLTYQAWDLETDIDMTLDAPGNNDDDNDVGSNEGREIATSAKNVCCDKFREKLVRHFNILFHFKEVKWPSRIKK